MAAPPVKILTVGSAVGSIRDLFAKIKAIDAKHGKFDLVLCTGDFFGPPKNTEDEPNEDDEVVQLLDGRLEGALHCLHFPYTLFRISIVSCNSSNRMLFMQGEYPLPKRVVEKFAKTGGELGKSLFMMSKSGIVTTASGIRIACLGGIYDPSIYGSAEAAPGFMSPFFSYHTVDRLLSTRL
ncbi:hypothetical protein BJ912DRAFT_517139 [Pholiota molesta]|nr:hypothetical protein BJ912DRAFT_517139 [Pholiota molesta]